MNGADQEDAIAALTEAGFKVKEVVEVKAGPYAPISSGKEARRIRRIGERRARKGKVA